MDPENTSLFLQNLLLMQDNERLWRQAQWLDQVNKALLAVIKQRQQQLQQGTSGPSGSDSAYASGGGRSVSAAGANHKAKPAGGKQQPK